MSQVKLTQKDLNINAIWRPLSHILATNMAYMLFMESKQFQLKILNNSTNKNIITSDQPIINTYFTKIQELPKDKFELYYPQSPKKAILLTQKFTAETICNINDINIIKKYNDLIVNSSFHQIYGQQDTDLLEYK